MCGRVVTPNKRGEWWFVAQRKGFEVPTLRV